MAIRLGAGSTLTLASGLHDYNAAYRVYGWFNLNGLVSSGYLYFGTRTNNAEGHDGLWFDQADDQMNLEVKTPLGGGTYVVNQKILTGALAADTWYPFMFARESATDVWGWVNGTQRIGTTHVLSSRAAMQRLQFGDSQGFGITGLTITTDLISVSDAQQACDDALKEVSGRTYHAAWPLLIAGDYEKRWGSSGGTLTATGTITTIHQPATLPNYAFLPSSGNFTTFTPAFDAEWEDTEDADRITGTLVRGTTAITSKTGDEAVTTNNIDVLVRQYVYGPFTKAGTWDGRVIGSIRCQESAAAANTQAQMIVRIMAPDGTVRGTVVAAQTGTSNEWSTSLRSILFPKGAAAANGAAVSASVAFQIGDYLIIELGGRDVETTSTNRTLTMSFGENTSTLLDFTESDTGADCPWILFSFPFDLAMGAVGGTTYNSTLDGTLSFAGALANRPTKILAGSVTPAGALVKSPRKVLAGAITPSGALTKRATKILAGAVTPAGALTKRLSRALSGSIAPAGALASQVLKLSILSGAVSFSGALLKHTSRALSGAITPAGALTKRTARALAGAISPSGALATTVVKVANLAGALSFAGALQPRANKLLTGAVTFAGGLVRTTSRALSGVVSFVGTTAAGKITLKALAGVLSFAGAIAGTFIPNPNPGGVGKGKLTWITKQDNSDVT